MVTKIYMLTDITPMSEQAFLNALQAIDIEQLLKSPEEAIQQAGIELNEGYKLQLINEPEQVETLADKIVPLLLDKNNNLRLAKLKSISGGNITYYRGIFEA